MRRLPQRIRRLYGWLSGIPQRFLDYCRGSGDDEDEEYIDPWNLDYDPWNLDCDEPDWLERFVDWFRTLFYWDD